ncbi:MAG: hypothetical protein LEGION0398_MBIBDBAK_00677 [Legionellaceae bacterium]
MQNDINGLEITKRIREKERSMKSRAIIIAVTAFDEIYKKSSLEAGMDDYFEKPVNRENLDALLKKYH